MDLDQPEQNNFTMNSYDVKEEPKNLSEGFLEEIYSLQKQLLEGYIGIENLPPYPVNVNTKASQTLLKDFTGRVIEELSEGYESFVEISEMFEERGYMVSTDKEVNRKFSDKVEPYLQNANEENADALHFMVELLIYAGIEAEDINSKVDEYDEELGDVPDTLVKCFSLGRDWMLSDKIGIIYIGESHTWPLLNGPGDEAKLIHGKSLVIGGSKYDWTNYRIYYPVAIWAVTHHLNIARNFLKNKPWKQSQVMTQEAKYREYLIKAFILLCGYFDLLGMEAKDAYYLYFKKNRINLFRQKSKY